MTSLELDYSLWRWSRALGLSPREPLDCIALGENYRLVRFSITGIAILERFSSTEATQIFQELASNSNCNGPTFIRCESSLNVEIDWYIYDHKFWCFYRFRPTGSHQESETTPDRREELSWVKI